MVRLSAVHSPHIRHGVGVSVTPRPFLEILLTTTGFYINLPIGALVGILLIFTNIPEPHAKPRAAEVFRSVILKKFDLFGFVLFAPAAIELLLALQWGGSRYPWKSSTIIGLFCGSAATFVVFGLWERRMGNDAMIPGQLVKQRIVWSSCMTMSMMFGMTMVMAYYLPIYFQSVRGESALMSGVDLLPNILCQLVMAVLSGILSKWPASMPPPLSYRSLTSLQPAD